MIDNNPMLQRVEKYLSSKYVYCKTHWLNEMINKYKNTSKLEEEIFKEILLNDISVFIDKEKSNDYCNLSSLNDINTIKKNVSSKYLFLQINGYSNLCQPSYKPKPTLIDVLEKSESKFLEGNEEEKIAKKEKAAYKLEVTNGVDNAVAFEYEALPELVPLLEKKNSKILIGPNFDIRRGVIYLRRNNTKLL